MKEIQSNRWADHAVIGGPAGANSTLDDLGGSSTTSGGE
jgi:hypothetical protein